MQFNFCAECRLQLGQKGGGLNKGFELLEKTM